MKTIARARRLVLAAEFFRGSKEVKARASAKTTPANLNPRFVIQEVLFGRTTTARGAPLLRQLQLSGAELEEAETCRGQGRVASG
jgi:hypothetical protein